MHYIYLDGADECDRVAKVYKCGVDKDPVLVSYMMQVADVSTPVVRNFLITFTAQLFN